jgi:Amt family ammonium transporter
MWDFAGSTVVHSVGGWSALAGVILLGSRLGKYRADGSVNPIFGHNMSMVTLGGLVLCWDGSVSIRDPQWQLVMEAQ